MPTIYQILQGVPVGCHAWNKDRTEVVLSPNNHEAIIYKKTGNNWEPTVTFTEHDQRVTSLDWGHKTNRIVTCGQDRNAYVWELKDGKWLPTLALLRINRAATSVKWSPDETKFAVGSGARLISVCYFEEENNWWVSKHIKTNIRSTVTCVDWHPNSGVLVAGCSDFKVRIYAAGIKGIDKRPEATVWSDKVRQFGVLLREVGVLTGGWVHDVAFSPSGNCVAWVSHSSSIAFVDGTQGESAEPFTIYEGTLPKRAVTFVSENAVVAAGHDCVPTLYKKRGSNWALSKVLDEGKESASKGANTAMSRFKQLDSRAQAGDDDGTELNTTHQNTITQLSVFSGTPDKVEQVASGGLDGKICVWNIKGLA
jgi:actin related protein 2/3 complex subunit 1A/1B